METERQRMDDPAVIDCGQNLDIAGAREFQRVLGEVLERGGDIVLDASRLERVDGAALQLLLTVFRKIEVSPRRVSWREPSAQLVRAARILNLDEHLRLSAR